MPRVSGRRRLVPHLGPRGCEEAGGVAQARCWVLALCRSNPSLQRHMRRYVQLPAPLAVPSKNATPMQKHTSTHPAAGPPRR